MKNITFNNNIFTIFKTKSYNIDYWVVYARSKNNNVYQFKVWNDGLVELSTKK